MVLTGTRIQLGSTKAGRYGFAIYYHKHCLELAFLPMDILPGCFFSNSLASLRDYSQRLLSSLLDISDADAQRPIIFVCHSLGGIVCKQAIVLAHEEDHRYGKILAATNSIVFFGTPHRGAQGIADVGNAIGAVMNAFFRISQTAGITGTTRTDLLRTLTSNSNSLKDLALSFRNRLDKIDVVTFLETMTMPPLADLIVDRHSAIMEIRNEKIIPLFSSHVDMCRFGGKTHDYGAVSNAITRLARNAMRDRPIAANDRVISNSSLNEVERTCMILLNSADLKGYRAELPKHVQGTCKWILSHPQYSSWIKMEQTSLLWLTGEPGCGKTMLSAYLTEHLKLGSASLPNNPVFYFFCDDTIAMQRDASAIIRSVLHQMLQQHRNLIKHVKARYESYGPSLAASFPALWELFLKIAEELQSNQLAVVVDAVDECEDKSRTSFLNAVMALVHESQRSPQDRRCYIKFFITSRPSLGNFYKFDGYTKSRLWIEKHQSIVTEDVKLVIRSKVDEIAERLDCADDTKEYLEHELMSQADQTFLWLELILNRLETTSLASKKDIARIVCTFPQELAKTYETFWHRIPSRSQDHARKALRILIGSSRHLNLAEINVAFTIDKDHQSVSSVRSDLQPSITRTLQGIAGSFIRIHSSTVSLIHQSSKEFFTEMAMVSEDPIVRSCGVSLTDAALCLAWPCVQYLLLQDFNEDLFIVSRTSLETTDSACSLPSLGIGRLDDLSGLEDDHIFMDEGVLEAEICQSLANRYEFLDYSVMNWAKHFAKCENTAPESLQAAVCQLIRTGSGVLKNWLKYYWIKSNLEYPYPEDFDGITVSAFFNFPKLLQALLESDPGYDQLKKDQALFWAARIDSVEATGVLLQNGGDPNRRSIGLHTPVTISAEYGHTRMIETLLSDPHTELTSRGKSYRSALSLAAGNGHLEIVRILMARRDCLAAGQDTSGWTPLFWAAGGDHVAVIEHLFSHPAVDVNHTDNTGRSVLSWTSGDGLLRATRTILQHPQIDVNLEDSSGRSPLSWAAGDGQTDIVIALMRDRRVERSNRDLSQRGAISWACQGGHTETLRVLLKHNCGGADDADISGWTPLAWALYHKSTSTVEALISETSVRIDSQDTQGRTTLMWAASYGYLEVVQLLISRGANTMMQDNAGKTALDYAKIFDHTDVVQVLE